MLDLQTRISQLRRPSSLTRAARFGACEYRREKHLRRLLATEALPGHAEALVDLLEIERAFDDQRRARSGVYRLAQHVAVLIAIAGEAQLLRASPISVP